MSRRCSPRVGVTRPSCRLPTLWGRSKVVYLYPAGNSDRPPIRYNPPFRTGVRGLCHESQPRFLPARADRPGVGISHALLVVAIGARRRSTDTTHARDATPQTLHGAQILSGSHPETLLRCLCAGNRGSQAAALSSSTPDGSFDTRPPPSCRHLRSLLSRS